MVQALWITWYDLSDDGRETYLSWLHETYIPAILERPGFLGAAHYATVKKDPTRIMRREDTIKKTGESTVPAGEQYVLLFSAADAHVFANPSPTALHAGLPETGRSMLALRRGERLNIMVEAARVEGPEAKHYQDGMALAPCIQIGTYNCDYRNEEDMLSWYAQWRMAVMARLPGCIRTRRLASVVGWAKHAILYEFASLEARNQHFVTHEDGHADMLAWGDRVVSTLTHAPGSPNLARRLWPAVA